MRSFTDARRALTLIELTGVIALTGILAVTSATIYQAHWRSWSSLFVRSSLRSSLVRSIDVMTHHLIQAQSIDAVSESSITFTADLGNGPIVHRIYLYHPDDPEPNGLYEQDTYMLRFAQGDVSYGKGAILAFDIPRPVAAVFEQTGPVVSIRLNASKDSESVTFITSVRPRNI